MIDLSEKSIEENMAICKKYLERMSKIGMTLEIELGITGGEEDGVDNTDVDDSKLYTQPEELHMPMNSLFRLVISLLLLLLLETFTVYTNRQCQTNSKNSQKFTGIYFKKI